MYTLYEYPPSGNCYKPRLLMHQLRLRFERVTVDTQANETRTPEFLLLNPNGKVPTLKLPNGVRTALTITASFMFFSIR